MKLDQWFIPSLSDLGTRPNVTRNLSFHSEYMRSGAGYVKSICGLPESEVVSETRGLDRSHQLEASPLFFIWSLSDLGTSLNVKRSLNSLTDYMGNEAGHVQSISGLSESGVVSKTNGLVRCHLVEASPLLFIRSLGDLGTSLNVTSSLNFPTD